MSALKRGPGRPPTPEAQRPVSVLLKLPPDLLELATKRAEREGVTRAEWIRRALAMELARGQP